MPKSKKGDTRDEIDERTAREEGVTKEEAREINEAGGDGANPEWWKNENRKPGEVH